MRQTTSLTRWQRWRQALPFGVSLGLLEAVIFGIGIAYWSRLLPQQPVVIGLPLYLVIPAIAGYISRVRNPGELREAIWTGLRVGVTGLVTFMLGAILIFAFIFIRYLTITPSFNPHAPHQWGLYDPAQELATIASILLTLAILHCINIVLSAIGGWLGGVLTSQRGSAQGQAQTGG